jgi:hypothetical protein
MRKFHITITVFQNWLTMAVIALTFIAQKRARLRLIVNYFATVENTDMMHTVSVCQSEGRQMQMHVIAIEICVLRWHSRNIGVWAKYAGVQGDCRVVKDL